MTADTIRYIIIYIAVVSLVTFAVYGTDKRRAEKSRWRIPESLLIVLAVLGGSIGALAGMLCFHHKTKKAKFVVGIPIILLLQTASALVLLFLQRP